MNNFVAEPTVVTDDMGIQYDYISDEGAGTSLGLFAEWPAHRVEINDDGLRILKDKIANRSLSLDDIKDTGVYSLLEDIGLITDEESLSEYLNDLLCINNTENGYIYCLYKNCDYENEDGSVLKFYSNKDDMINDFQSRHIPELTRWSEMTDEESDYWKERRNEIEEFYLIDHK